jgi:hypothetical protein
MLALRTSALLLVATLGCSGATVSIPDASVDDGGSGTDAFTCSGGTLACGAKCVDPALDPANCGTCGKACGVGEVCSAGKCGIACQPGFSPCTGSGADGGMTGPVCVNLMTDVNNCGACGKVCSGANGVPSCNAGTCGIACIGTYQDCDKNPTNGCEVDIASDGKSCGKCGHDCLSGGCANSLCQPVAIASGQNGPWMLALDANNIYWTTYAGGQVRSCAKNGCNNTPATLASGQQGPYGIAVDGTNVYWANFSANTVQKCAVGGCGGNPTTLASSQTGAIGVAVDANAVYWTNITAGQVQKCATGGCGGNPTTLATLNAPYLLAVDNTNVYWSGGNAIRKCTTTNCGNNYVQLAGSTGSGITVDGTDVYWSGNAIQKCAIGGCGGNPTTLVSGGFAFGIAVDGTDVYWASPGAGSISKCAKGGCNNTPTVIAGGQGNPEQVVVDANAVYWANYTGGSVMKLAK